MTAEAEVRGALMSQQVAVVGAVSFVTGGAALDAGGFVLVEERAAFVGMAADALFLLEAGQMRSGRGGMRVVAGRAGHDSFLESMPLVGLEMGKNIRVARRTILGDAAPEQSGGRVAVDAVAGGAVERGFGMRAGAVPGIVLVVAGQASGRLFSGGFGRTEGEEVPLAFSFRVLLGTAVAGGAALVAQLGVRLGREGRDRFFMANAAGRGVFRLRGGTGRREQPAKDESGGEDSESAQQEPEKPSVVRRSQGHTSSKSIVSSRRSGWPPSAGHFI